MHYDYDYKWMMGGWIYYYDGYIIMMIDVSEILIIINIKIINVEKRMFRSNRNYRRL